MQITGDNDEGKRELDNFTDPEQRYPVIATTSELMTTGIDAITCKVIVSGCKHSINDQIQTDNWSRDKNK